ncbi:unnamed protein product [Closterium sp. Naga37s-1]|nr:unnamed protein product [Closterium sp. Naga37s-1]
MTSAVPGNAAEVTQAGGQAARAARLELVEVGSPKKAASGEASANEEEEEVEEKLGEGTGTTGDTKKVLENESVLKPLGADEKGTGVEEAAAAAAAVGGGAMPGKSQTEMVGVTAANGGGNRSSAAAYPLMLPYPYADPRALPVSAAPATAPEDTPAAPEVTPVAPEVVTTSPETTTEVAPAAPEAVSAAPEAVSAAPEAVSAAPEAVSAAPEAVTAAPEAVTAAPEAVTVAPEAVTVAPEADSAAPEAIPAEPPVSEPSAPEAPVTKAPVPEAAATIRTTNTEPPELPRQLDDPTTATVAATRIQSAWRGRSLRLTKPLEAARTIAEVRRLAREMAERLGEEGYAAKVASEPKEKLRVSETIMSWLLRLDALLSPNQEVRELRRGVVRELTKLQDRVDSLKPTAMAAELVSVPAEPGVGKAAEPTPPTSTSSQSYTVPVPAAAPEQPPQKKQQQEKDQSSLQQQQQQQQQQQKQQILAEEDNGKELPAAKTAAAANPPAKTGGKPQSKPGASLPFKKGFLLGEPTKKAKKRADAERTISPAGNWVVGVKEEKGSSGKEGGVKKVEERKEEREEKVKEGKKEERKEEREEKVKEGKKEERKEEREEKVKEGKKEERKEEREEKVKEGKKEERKEERVQTKEKIADGRNQVDEGVFKGGKGKESEEGRGREEADAKKGGFGADFSDSPIFLQYLPHLPPLKTPLHHTPYPHSSRAPISTPLYLHLPPATPLETSPAAPFSHSSFQPSRYSHMASQPKGGAPGVSEFSPEEIAWQMEALRQENAHLRRLLSEQGQQQQQRQQQQKHQKHATRTAGGSGGIEERLDCLEREMEKVKAWRDCDCKGGWGGYGRELVGWFLGGL